MGTAAVKLVNYVISRIQISGKENCSYRNQKSIFLGQLWALIDCIGHNGTYGINDNILYFDQMIDT